MRLGFVLLFTSVFASVANAEPVNETIRGLEECFALTRTADAICDNAANAAVRLDCLRKSRSAQQDCLEHLRSGLTRNAAPPTAEPKPGIEAPRGPPGTTSGSDTPAEQSPNAGRSAGPGPAEDLPQTTQATPRPSSPSADPPPRPELGRPSSGWIVSQTASPVDYSPLLVAELRSLGSSKPGAPSALVLGCRAMRTDISVRTSGTWRPSRTGDVEIVFAADGRPVQRFRWRLAPDGRSASSMEDAANMVQGLGGARLSIAVTDATGEVGTATFELVGIEAVREKLAAACRWPSIGDQSRTR